MTRTLSRPTLVLLTLVSVQAAFAESPAWRDSTRDVYVDGQLDRGVKVLSADAGKKTAVLLPGARKALILDRETSTFAVMPRKAFTVAGDGAWAELAADAKGKPGGAFQSVDSSASILTWKGKTVLVSRHQGLVGDVTEETLFAAVPVWRQLLDAYAPTAAALANEQRPVTMTVVFGTWCGDSKEFVPRIVKTVRAAAGILQQDLVLPPSFAFSAPAIAASGWMGGRGRAAASGATSQLVCYVAPSGFQSPLGTTCVVTHRVAGEEAVTVPAGEFRATHLARQSGAEASDWWIHPELGIPVRGQVIGGLEYVLSELAVSTSGS